MKIYYYNEEFEPGKHRILAVNLDRDDFGWKNTIRVLYSVLKVDEVDPENKGVCIDIIAVGHATDVNGNEKYYVGDDGNLYEVEDWEEHTPPEEEPISPELLEGIQ